MSMSESDWAEVVREEIEFDDFDDEDDYRDAESEYDLREIERMWNE